MSEYKELEINGTNLNTSGSIIKSNNSGFGELFQACFHEYYESLHRYAYTIVRENEQAKDIVQTVFCKWWEKRMELKIETSIKSYLYKAVYNLSLNHVRNIKNRKTYTVDFGQNKFDITESKHDMNDNKEMEMQLKTAIEGLPLQCRLIFLKSRFDRKTYAEIAADLNLSVKTVEAQIGKALKSLRSHLMHNSSNKI